MEFLWVRYQMLISCCTLFDTWLTRVINILHRERLDALPEGTEDLSFGNSVYRIRFEERENKPTFGHKYWFFLQDAVENVPEYIVRWQNFVE